MRRVLVFIFIIIQVIYGVGGFLGSVFVLCGVVLAL